MVDGSVMQAMMRRFGAAERTHKWIDGADSARECAKLNAAFVHDLCTPRRVDITTG